MSCREAQDTSSGFGQSEKSDDLQRDLKDLSLQSSVEPSEVQGPSKSRKRNRPKRRHNKNSKQTKDQQQQDLNLASYNAKSGAEVYHDKYLQTLLENKPPVEGELEKIPSDQLITQADTKEDLETYIKFCDENKVVQFYVDGSCDDKYKIGAGAVVKKTIVYEEPISTTWNTEILHNSQSSSAAEQSAIHLALRIILNDPMMSINCMSEMMMEKFGYNLTAGQLEQERNLTEFRSSSSTAPLQSGIDALGERGKSITKTVFGQRANSEKFKTEAFSAMAYELQFPDEDPFNSESKYVIFTDCKSTVDILNHPTRKNINSHELIFIYGVLRKYKNITLKFIRAHNDLVFNDLADMAANENRLGQTPQREKPAIPWPISEKGRMTATDMVKIINAKRDRTNQHLKKVRTHVAVKHKIRTKDEFFEDIMRQRCQIYGTTFEESSDYCCGESLPLSKVDMFIEQVDARLLNAGFKTGKRKKDENSLTKR